MEVEISTQKTVEENADDHFQKSKKARQKLLGLERAMLQVEKKIGEEKGTGKNKKTPAKKRQREWFEKFHWFETSKGKMCLAGRDKHSNEQLIKKHFEDRDILFHADIAGAAHCVLKEGKEAEKEEKKEAAEFAAVWTKAWGTLASVDVYSAEKNQVSKRVPSGESIGTGAFMVYGKREWHRKNTPRLAVFIDKKRGIPACSPVSTAEKLGRKHAEISQGERGKNETAKHVKSILAKQEGAEASAEDIMQLLPPGGMKAIAKQ